MRNAVPHYAPTLMTLTGPPLVTSLVWPNHTDWEVALVDLREARTAAQQEERVCTALGIEYVSGECE